LAIPANAIARRLACAIKANHLAPGCRHQRPGDSDGRRNEEACVIAARSKKKLGQKPNDKSYEDVQIMLIGDSLS
jgi:hypothetical protein